MANNYTMSSSFVSVPKNKLPKARDIALRISKQIEETDGYVGFHFDVQDGKDGKAIGVWIYDEESINPDHVEKLVRELVETLELKGIFLCSWASTCSSPRINEFGGGAFALQRGKDTIWIDAAKEAEDQLAKA